MSREAWVGLEAPDPGLEAALRARLDEVESALARAVASDVPLVSRAAGHLLAAGGKRFRPLLVLLTGHFADPGDARLVPGAVAIELTHLATLYHDDVIDEADTRRGTASVNARWDNTVAILAGDYLFATSSRISSDLGTDVTRILATTIAQVCEGQIREIQRAGAVESDEGPYLDTIRRKTASLIATSCRLGGMLSRADHETIERLERYGHALGMAFQLSDDIMDLVSDEATLGKKPGADLREGVYTLPVILALRDSARSDELRALLAPGPPRGERFASALELVRSDGALDLARGSVGVEVRRAISEAEPLPQGPPREALLHLARFLAARCDAPV